MRRLLACVLVWSALLACGGDDDGTLFNTGAGGNAGGAGTVKVDAAHPAESGAANAGGASGSDGAVVGADVSVGSDGGPESGNAGSAGAQGNDANDVSIAPSDATDGGTDRSDSPGDAGNSDAPYCNAPADCPVPANVCMTATCVDYACGTTPVAQGQATSAQTAGDCKRVVCDGSGSTQSVNDDGDAPSDDNTCTTDGCSGGNPTHTPIGIGTVCSGGHCDGQGKCAQCLAPSDCGQATFCSSPSCNNGTCGVVYTAPDTPLPTQTTGNCKVNVCDGAGGTRDNVDDSDKPDDSNVCTVDTCGGGTPGHTVLTGHGCGVSGVCNDQGNCVGCNSPADCGADDFCKARTCVSNTCGVSLIAADTKLPDNQQTDKDCKKKVCDGSGNIQTVADSTDPPTDANECTLDQCSGSTPVNSPAAPGAPCSTGVCDGSGACFQCLGPANCPATGNACTRATCNNHLCGTENQPPDTICGAGPSCNTGQGHAQDKCNSLGVCVAGSNSGCSPYACGASACKTSCSGDGDCTTGYSCDTGLAVCTNGPKCTDYCSTIMANCVGSNAQYFDLNACLKSCAVLPRGTVGEGGGNTVGCRTTHAGPGYAAVDPVTHCPHAGPGGAGVCSASNCDGFCTIAQAICKAPNPAIFADTTACLGACGSFPMTPAYNASTSSGDSFACRMWHLTAAASIDAVVHCPHIATVSTACY